MTVSFSNKEGRVEAMQAALNTALEAVCDPERWTEWLRFQSRFHSYSFRNTILIQMQRPGATLVAGFQTWKNVHKRIVVRGEKAIWILAPMAVQDRKKDPDGTLGIKRMLFKGVTVFDVSQTDGEPLPVKPVTSGTVEGDAPEGMVDDLTARIESLGYKITRNGSLHGEDGYTDPRTKVVNLTPGKPAAHEALTLAHELAHIVLGHVEPTYHYHGEGRSSAEIEAESAAFITASAWGLDNAGTSSFGYIAGWAQGELAKIKRLADRSAKAAKAILGDLADVKVLPQPKAAKDADEAEPEAEKIAA